MRTALPLIVLPLILLGPCPVHAADVKEREIDGLAEKALTFWRVPGTAIAVVHKGEVVYLEGHGRRSVKGEGKVTADTLFPLASCTKAFTSTALAMLADEGKVSWDDHVRKHVPFFHLSDPLADADVRLRDLACHRTGLGRHDLLWYRSPWPQEEIVRRAGKLPLSAPFRTAFHYQSTMYNALGLVVESASGMPWEQFLKKRIFGPLKMTSAVCTGPEAEKAEDRAAPHRTDEFGRPNVAEAYPMPRPDAAGSVYASARDLTGWLLLHLGEGKVGGRRLVSRERLAETHAPQMVLPMDESEKAMFPETRMMNYAMGWVVLDYRGRGMLAHTGVIDGFRVQITLVPEEQLGVAVLSNLHATRMNLALSNAIVDRFLGAEKTDWNRTLKTALRKRAAAAAEAERARLAGRKPGTRPTLPLGDLAGEYEHPAYGAVRVALERGVLVWRWQRWEGRLEHFQYNTFTLPIAIMGNPEVTFVVEGGKATGMKVGGEIDLTFRRVKEDE
jgi:CubicO group peptidase (beta-lactamase class C family)